MDDQQGIGYALRNLGALLHTQGDLEGAQKHYEDSLAMQRANGARPNIAFALSSIGLLACDRRDLPGARARLQEALTVAQSTGSRSTITMALEVCACLAAAQRQTDAALQLAGAAAALRDVAGISGTPGWHTLVERHLNGARETLGEQSAALYNEGRFLPLDEALATARRVASTDPVVLPPAPVSSEQERPGGHTERQLEVARLVARGDTNRQIAEKLVISERTAEHHVENILAKLDMASRTQLAVWAGEHGLTD